MKGTAYYLSPIGWIELTNTGDRISSVRFVEEVGAAQATGALPPVIHECIRQLEQYFNGQRTAFSVPLAPAGTPFQRRVWEQLCTIPYGQTVSYRERGRIMAERTIRKLGDPILRARCKAVQSITPHVCKLLDDMAETLYAGPNRAGLAAPQIGIPKRLIVMDCGEGPTVPVRFETQHLRLSEVLKPLQRVLIRFYQYRITRQVNLELNHRLLPICSIAMLGRIEEADHDEMFAGKGWPSK